MDSGSRGSRADPGLLRGWLLLAAGAAATSGLLAVAVAAGRLPGVRVLSPPAFSSLLVGHVAFSLIVWLLGGVVVAVLVSGNGCGSRAAGWCGLVLAAAGSILLLGTSLAGRGRAILSDYVPVVETPAYLAGLALVAAGAGVAVGSVLRPAAGSRASPAAWGASCVALAFAATLLAAAVGILRAGGLSYQVVFWGAGHALQFVYAGTMAMAWYTLAQAGLGAVSPAGPLVRMAFALYPLLALAGAAIYAAPDPAALPGLWRLNLALGAGISVPTLLHLGAIAAAVAGVPRRAWRGAAGHPEVAALVLSVAFYLLGGLLAPVGIRGTLRVTAHYHAMLVGGVTVALMGMVHHVLGAHGWARGDRRMAALQLWVFGAGVLATVAVLAWAGALGAPRKMAGVVAASGPWADVLRLMAVAAVPAVAGGALFVGQTLAALLRPGPPVRVPAGARAAVGSFLP